MVEKTCVASSSEQDNISIWGVSFLNPDTRPECIEGGSEMFFRNLGRGAKFFRNTPGGVRNVN